MNSDEPPNSPRNAAAITALRALLQASPGERVYIHCYLGKHRSRTVLAALESDR
jgi:protein-tyrosine phosphatase